MQTKVSTYYNIMTEKKEKILKTALNLFATFGYESVSTARIAKRARVSEALIFKHYRTKIMLLDTVVNYGQEGFKEIVTDIVLETNPKKRIIKYIDLAFKIGDKDLLLWKLEYKLRLNPTITINTFQKPIHTALSEAFQSLKFKNPKIEAQLLMYTIDGFLVNVLSGEMTNSTKLKSQLKNKYSLK